MTMDTGELQLIFEYNYWANAKMLAGAHRVALEQYVAPAAFPYGGLRGTLVHILEAEWSWRLRFQGLGYGDELLPDVFATPAELEAHWHAEEHAMRTFLGSLRNEDLGRHVRYTSLDGAPRDRILWQSLLHVAFHGTQHRAEAAALLTEYGHSPGDIDFNVFLDGQIGA
jgi:uncharacterized damage-inducible protein DinB